MNKRGPQDTAFQALQAKWDAKLKASGFRDIEAGVDLAQYHASTIVIAGNEETDGKRPRRRTIMSIESFSGANGGRAQLKFGDEGEPSFKPLDSINFITIGQTDTFNFWFLAVRHAINLPTNYKHRKLLREIAETGNVAGTAIAHGMKPQRARKAWHRFLDRSGLPRSSPRTRHT
jgi:hypothetical protein